MEPSAKTKIAGMMTTPGKNPKLSRSMMSEGSKSATKSVNNMSLVMTPGKSPNLSRSKTAKGLSFGENVSPNLVKSVNGSEESVAKDLRLLVSPRDLRRERRFVIAKKRGSKVCEKCKEKGVNKCICVAYQSLRASQETFFDNQCEAVDPQIERSDFDQNTKLAESEDLCKKPQNGGNEVEEESEVSSAAFKRNRDTLLQEARESVPEPGCGRVMHLVKAFEKLLSMKKKSDDDDGEGDETRNDLNDPEDGGVEFYKQFTSSNKKVMNWALPGMQQQQLSKECESGYSHESISSFCPSDLFLNSDKLGLESRSSFDGSFGSVSSGAATGGGSRRKRNSTESCGSFGGRRWKRKQPRVTNQNPFKLRTEQRGRMKEEELMRKIRKMTEEQERLRIPIAQGLPWTTDEPECLVKPPVKEITQPIDLKLHSDIRAVERAEFDHKVAEKMSLIEQYKMEREKQQKLAEEEEIKRLRKELVPKAQPMPYFDRPFIPRRSEKSPTIPKEPKFHIPEHKKISFKPLSPDEGGASEYVGMGGIGFLNSLQPVASNLHDHVVESSGSSSSSRGESLDEEGCMCKPMCLFFM